MEIEENIYLIRYHIEFYDGNAYTNLFRHKTSFKFDVIEEAEVIIDEKIPELENRAKSRMKGLPNICCFKIN